MIVVFLRVKNVLLQFETDDHDDTTFLLSGSHTK